MMLMLITGFLGFRLYFEMSNAENVISSNYSVSVNTYRRCEVSVNRHTAKTIAAVNVSRT